MRTKTTPGVVFRRALGKTTPGVVLATLLLAAASCASEPQSWAALQKHLGGLAVDQRAAAIERFVSAKGGTPIIENQTRLVFLAQDVNGTTPRVVGDFNGWASTPQGYDATVGVTTRIAGTSWSFLVGSAYTNARLEYVFLFDAEATPDPLNPRTVMANSGPRSEARMPFWVAQPETDDESDVAAGLVLSDTIASRSLRGPRRVWYYLPPGYDADAETLYPVMYVLDGGNYIEKMDVPRVLDRLIARKAIRPVVAVFSEPVDRQEEYSRDPKWRAFMTTELVPLVDQRFRTFPAPSHRAIVGSSYGAYGAVDLAVEFPSIFGLSAAIAPPPQTASLITNQAHAQAAVVSIRFFVLGGVYDSMIDGARNLRTTLDEFDAPVSYLEVPEGHNTNTFRGHLDDALKALFADDAGGAQ